jgi:cation diffusion facilitator CzcD-associated flavoprotein CzcO
VELNVWTSTTIQNSEYDDKKGLWSVELKRENETRRTLSPKHIVFCTGQAGEPKLDTFAGQHDFRGSVYHGSQHQDASVAGNVKGKKVVVVGTGNSGHDIAQNFHENGADVTMLQRSGTYVLTAKTGLFMLHEGMYEQGGPPIEDADIIGQSLPIPVQFSIGVDLTKRIAAAEEDTRVGLTKAGFLLDDGIARSGIYRKYITRGGGYYIDVGCSQLIIDGKIKVVKSPNGISHLSHHSLELENGISLPADIVVLATGYDNMRTMVTRVLGAKIAERCKDVWDLDDEGEVNAVSP